MLSLKIFIVNVYAGILRLCLPTLSIAPSFPIHEESGSEAGQESWVLSILENKRGGTYVEIGACHSRQSSNTFVLEAEYGWDGVGLEIETGRVLEYSSNRRNPCLQADATAFDYKAFLTEKNFPRVIDYLQIDIEPARNSLKALELIPFVDFQFRCITFEHDLYRNPLNFLVKRRAKKILTGFGYQMAIENVRHKGHIFEDWWVHPDLVSAKV